MAGESVKTAAAIGSACVHVSEAAAQNLCAAMLSAGPPSCSQTGESAHVRPGIFLNLQRLRYFDKVQQEVKAHVRGSQGMACRPPHGIPLCQALAAGTSGCRARPPSCHPGGCKQADGLHRKQVCQAQAAVHTCAGGAQRRQSGSAWALVMVHHHDMH